MINRYYKLLMLLVLPFVLLALGCSNRKGSTNSITTEGSLTGSASSTIQVTTVEKEKILKEYQGVQDVLLYQVEDENEKDIYIEPASTYYNQYVGGQEFEIPLVSFFDTEESTEYVSYPKLKLFITNNSETDFNINKLEVSVESSTIDELPYVHIGTEEAHSNTMAIVNECWSNWGSAKLEYTLLKKNESFDGEYKNTKTIGYSEGIQRIDFTNDLMEMGYDYQSVKAKSESDDENYIGSYITSGNFNEYAQLFYPFEIGSYDGNTYFGFARIHGKLSFSNMSVKFKGKISLSSEGSFGAGLEEDDSFDIQLRDNGANYNISKPYVTSIKPNNSEMITLTFMSEKSSNHKLVIKAINDEGVDVKTKTINLHLLNPVYSSKHIWEKKKQYVEQ